MSHLDEGQLHALLDDELDPAERKAAEAHLADCAECRREYAEARALLTGTDDLIRAVEVPPRSTAGSAAPRLAPARFRWRTVAWAASVVLAVGLGWQVRSDQFKSPQPVSSAQKLDDGAMAAPRVDSLVSQDQRRQEAPAETKAAAAAGASVPAAQPIPSPAKDEAPEASRRLYRQAPKPETPAPVATEKNSAAPAQDALRALTNPADKPAAQAREKAAPPAEPTGLASKTTSEERAAPPAAAPPAAAPQAANQVGSKEVETVAPGAAVGALVPAPASRRDRAGGVGFQPTPLEGAVRILGGSIRLVDGMTPTHVLVGPGTLVEGADPRLAIVRVVYNDPPGRELWLDQQRPDAGFSEADQAGLAATALLPGDTLVASHPGGGRSLRWIHQTGFRLGLTGFLPADSLRALARRVQ